MAVSLTKGQRVSLEKVAPGLSEVFVGLGWDVKTTDTGFDFDLDSSIFLLGANEKMYCTNTPFGVLGFEDVALDVPYHPQSPPSHLETVG